MLLYSVLFYLLLPFIFLRLAWRSLRAPAYRQRWAERMGDFLFPPSYQGAIWIHAVSVGEAMVAIPLIKALRAARPQQALVITTTTPTGSERVRTQLGDDVFHVYCPYDVPLAVNRFLLKVQPSLFICMETELWPNILNGCHARGIPILLANARLSLRSFRRYQRVGFFMKHCLPKIDHIAAQTEVDAWHFEQLGVPRDQISVSGNIKFDLRIERELSVRAEQRLQRWQAMPRPIWIAASTHPGEDEPVLAAFEQVRRDLPTSLLILVPRHPERFAEVAARCRRHGLPTVLHSTGQPCTADTAVYLGDTMGELLLLLALAQVCFMGGSLVPTGGHNVLEPAALGLATLTGPHVFNFKAICEKLTAAEALLTVQSTEELAQQVTYLLSHPEACAEMGRRAKAVVAENGGALKAHLAIIQDLLPAGTRWQSGHNTQTF